MSVRQASRTYRPGACTVLTTSTANLAACDVSGLPLPPAVATTSSTLHPLMRRYSVEVPWPICHTDACGVPLTPTAGKRFFASDNSPVISSASTDSTAALESFTSSDYLEQLSPSSRGSDRDMTWEFPAALDLQIGAHTITGAKLDFPKWQNQDAHLVIRLGTGRALIAVFDGHGQWGHLVAACARQVFAQNVHAFFPLAPVHLSDDMAGAGLRKLFLLADEAIKREIDTSSGRPLAEFSGSTATAAIIDAGTGKMAVAHVGDSALMLCVDQKVLHRTADHVVDAHAEQRIVACGGEVQTFTVSGVTARRVCMRGSNFPGLAMARAMGDLVARSLGVIAVPDVRTGLQLPAGGLLVLASDGVWEKMPEEVVARFVEGVGPPQPAAQVLVETARRQWPAGGNIDDITAIVVSWQAAAVVPEAPRVASSGIAGRFVASSAASPPAGYRMQATMR